MLGRQLERTTDRRRDSGGAALRAGLAVALATLAGAAQAMDSAHYSIPKLVENNGSGFRVGRTFQLTGDTISPQPVETSTSASHVLQGRPLVMVASTLPSCGIFVNDNQPLTNTVNVTLSLICGHATGCAAVQLSNNGVGWSSPQPYPTSSPWALTANDGSDSKTSPTAQVYAGPITVAADATVRAFATDPGGNQGAVVSETYEICDGSNLGLSGTVVDATRDNAPMPLVVITPDSGHSTDTSLTGQYSFTGLPRGRYIIESVTAPMPGYVTYQAEFKLSKTSLAHDIVLTRDGTVYGTDTNSGYSSEGVNTSTGNFAHQEASCRPAPAPSPPSPSCTSRPATSSAIPPGTPTRTTSPTRSATACSWRSRTARSPPRGGFRVGAPPSIRRSPEPAPLGAH